ncbi:hypothetical protein [Longitalea arenae]|uniref:hypothetical protein n=1 Tax=Longitalea arenae TaxID=2812558 RepID=UPI001968A2F4|nr:hypothetical protein [Longitalea arenae]
MKRKLALNFKETKDSDLYLIANYVVESMTDNEYFPDPGMMIIELREISTQFSQAMSEAGNKDRVKIAIKNDLKVLLIKKLKEVGAFVRNESKGAETPMFSSGFPIFTPREEIILKAPTHFKVLPGANPGEILMKVRRVHGAKSYQYRWTPDPITPASVWQSEIDTRCKRVIRGLPLGINYWFEMIAIGSNSQMVYTQRLSRYIS